MQVNSDEMYLCILNNENDASVNLLANVCTYASRRGVQDGMGTVGSHYDMYGCVRRHKSAADILQCDLMLEKVRDISFSVV